MNMFLISIKGKFNILVKISDLQNFISYNQKPDLWNSTAGIQNPFLFMKYSPFSPFTKW